MREARVFCDICGKEQIGTKPYSQCTLHYNNLVFPLEGLGTLEVNGDWCYDCRKAVYELVLNRGGPRVRGEERF